MELTHVHTLNIRGVLSVSKRIILAKYYWHFISFSLFFLPLSFTLIISPNLIHRLSYQPFTYNHLIAYLVYTIIVFILALCATGTIIYSTHHAFFGEPITFLDTLKSLTFSFFPLAFTAIIAYVLIVLISITFLMLVSTALMLVQSLVFVIDYNSVYFLWFSAIMGAILIAIVIYFYVEWSLAFVVVMVESKWGFSALMRSAYLVKGMRSVSLLVMLYFGLCGAVFVLIFSTSFYKGWPFSMLVFNTMVGSFFLLTCLLRLTAANTVLYNYCKALHGELELEVGDGFVHEYMNLPSGD